MTDKDQQFTRLWNEKNAVKRGRFRNLMESKLAARKLPFTEANARSFYNGAALAIPTERIYESERGPSTERFQRPARRVPPRRRPGGGRR